MNNFYGKLYDKMVKLAVEIAELMHDTTYDIDTPHHIERMRIIRQKRIELRKMKLTFRGNYEMQHL